MIAREFKAAAATIDEAIKTAPTNLRAYDVKAMLALAQKDEAAALKVYQELKIRLPKSRAR